MTASSRFLTYVFVLGMVQFKFVLVFGDCWFDNRKHEENAEVPTGEPCLNCTCSRSVLLCYLRVCPKLPNPPPPGCILLHRYRTCCPELICSDFYDGGNSLEARADPEGDLDIPSDDQTAFENACISNGSIYGPGSAMHSSSLCEYCYCLAGKQICVKPKCLLPIEGCTPVFEETSCCPVRYNCTRKMLTESSTEEATTVTATTSSQLKTKDGCLVEGAHYHEGSKVIGIGHSVCDNCYCLRGLLRCEPLSCAPPLLGCTPVVKPGECCAASYNCNGTLEIEPEPNYGLFPTISKEYSKLRKEVQHKPPTTNTRPIKDGVVTVAPFYVLAETLQEPTTKLVYQRSPDTFGTTRQFSGANLKPSTTQKPTSTTKISSEDNFFLISSSKQRTTTEKPGVVTGSYHATTNYEFQNTNYKRVYSTTLRSTVRPLPTSRVVTQEPKEESPDYLGFGNLNILSIVNSLLDGKMYRTVNEGDGANNDENRFNSSEPEDFNLTSGRTTTESSSILETSTGIMEITTTSEEPTSTLGDDGPTLVATEEDSRPVTMTTVVKSTDCLDNVEQHIEKADEVVDITTVPAIDPGEINRLADSTTDFISTTNFEGDDSSSEASSTEEIDDHPEIESRKKLNIISSKLPPDIEAILNITKHKNGDDFDYDYNEPTLPPSLPNLKIIPFVAADALDAKKESPKDPTPVYMEKKNDIGPLVYASNMFKPPIETEGGFVPKEPSIIDTFYDNVVSVPSITSESNNQNNVVNCISEGQEILHGMSVASESPCMTCTCFYGNIVCQKSNCPLPKSGCKVAVEQGATLCCPNYVCDDSIGQPLEISDVRQEIVTVAEGIIPADPFKGVIRTEPAPNLQSLIGDMISYQKITSTTSVSSTAAGTPPMPNSSSKIETTTPVNEEEFGLDKVIQFIFSGIPDVIEKPISQTPSAPTNESTSPKPDNTKIYPEPISSNTASSTYESKPETTNKPATSTSYIKIDLIKNTNSYKNTTTENNIETTKTKTLNTNVRHQLKTDNRIEETKNKNSFGLGLLQLAGCNIYGRMYRVGRIISELSGPCLECKCTEIGVQCRQLKCLNGTN